MALPKIEFEPYGDLFEDGHGRTKSLLQDAVLKDLKMNVFTGVLEGQLKIDLSSGSGDILVSMIDPEKALGYSVYDSVDQYYEGMSEYLLEPDDDTILRGSDV